MNPNTHTPQQHRATRLPRFIAIMLATIVAGSHAQEASEKPTNDDHGLRVLVWNVLRGGNNVDQGPEKALAVIRAAEPDIVLLQESYDIDGDRPRLGEWLASELGWNQHQAQSAHLCVLTPLELETTFFHHEWHGVGARIRTAQDHELLVWSIWIDYRAFVGYELRDNPAMSDKELLEAESVRSNRLQQATAIIDHLRTSDQLASDMPLLVGGDWNTPSHLDWTEDTARVFKNRRTLPLPVSKAMHKAGFTDVFRALHPNPVQHPGITWSPMFRGPRSGQEGTAQSFERIDRLYLKNPAEPSERWTLRPIAADVLPLVWEDDSIPADQRTFPSDHGALLVDLEWIAPAGRDNREQ